MRKLRLLSVTVAVLTLFCLISARSESKSLTSLPPESSDLDTTFNGTGSVTLAGFGASTSAVQNDGKIVVGGYSQDPAGFALLRFNTDGTLDTSFGGTGKVVAQALGGYALAIQTDGKIVVV